MPRSIQRQLHDKGREIQEHLADVVATLRRNVREGIQSAVEGEGWTFGRPPFKGPPSRHPPMRRSVGRRRSDVRRVPTRARTARRRDD